MNTIHGTLIFPTKVLLEKCNVLFTWPMQEKSFMAKLTVQCSLKTLFSHVMLINPLILSKTYDTITIALVTFIIP